MNIKIKKHVLIYKNYKLKCSIGKSGITSSKKRVILQRLEAFISLAHFTTERTEINHLYVKLKKKL